LQFITHNETHIHAHTAELLWTRDRAVAETSTWQYTTLTSDRYPCHRRDSNSKSQHACVRKLTP